MKINLYHQFILHVQILMYPRASYHNKAMTSEGETTSNGTSRGTHSTLQNSEC